MPTSNSAFQKMPGDVPPTRVKTYSPLPAGSTPPPPPRRTPEEEQLQEEADFQLASNLVDAPTTGPTNLPSLSSRGDSRYQDLGVGVPYPLSQASQVMFSGQRQQARPTNFVGPVQSDLAPARPFPHSAIIACIQTSPVIRIRVVSRLTPQTRPSNIENSTEAESPYDQVTRLQQQDIVSEDVPASPNEMSCITCCENRRAYATLPCYHLDLCGKCTLRHREGLKNERGNIIGAVLCPRCRAYVTGFQRVYL